MITASERPGPKPGYSRYAGRGLKLISCEGRSKVHNLRFYIRSL